MRATINVHYKGTLLVSAPFQIIFLLIIYFDRFFSPENLKFYPTRLFSEPEYYPAQHRA